MTFDFFPSDIIQTVPQRSRWMRRAVFVPCALPLLEDPSQKTPLPWEGAQRADKGVSTVILTKSFGQAFSKACAVEGAEPSSPSAEGEIPYTAFSFGNFSFAPMVSKEKVAMSFMVFTIEISLVYTLRDAHFLQT